MGKREKKRLRGKGCDIMAFGAGKTAGYRDGVPHCANKKRTEAGTAS